MTFNILTLRTDAPSLPSVSKEAKSVSPHVLHSLTGRFTKTMTTPPQTAKTSRKAVGVSAKLLGGWKEEAEHEVMRTLRHKRFIVEAPEENSVLIRSLSNTRLQLPVPDRPVILELLEAKWSSMPVHWSIDRKILECTLNPPEVISALDKPISKQLVEVLSKSPTGRKVLREAVAHMPKARLKIGGNEPTIMRALKERNLSSIQGFVPARRLRPVKDFETRRVAIWDPKRRYKA